MDTTWRPDPRDELRTVLVDDAGVRVAHVVRLNALRGDGHVWHGAIDTGPRARQETGPCATLVEAQTAVEELLAGRRRRYVKRDTRYRRPVSNAPIRAPHPGVLRRPPTN